jgi:Cft2 family RNA processing exonuclease
VAEAQKALNKLVVVPAGRQIQVGDSQIGLTPTGHLLGALSVRFTAQGCTT